MTSEVSTATDKTLTALSSQLKTTVFRYKGQIGHVPKETETFLFVKRTNPRTRVSKIVPEVVYPIQANRYKGQIGHVPKETETFLFVKRTNPRTRVSKIVPEVVYPIQANRYKGQIGHVPKETETFLFVKRTNPRTRVSKIVPEVVYPIQANRPPVPKHALLEDDWRAYRSVLFNYQSLVWSQMDPLLRVLESLRCNRLVSSIYKNLAREIQRAPPPTDFAPALALYQNSVDAPLGYMYRRYKQGCRLSDTSAESRPRKKELHVPVLLFEGPFMDTVQVSQGPRVKQQWDQEMQYYDADVIVTSNKRPKMYIYNEPDSIPLSCARSDFSVPLSQRAKDMASFSSNQAASACWH